MKLPPRIQTDLNTAVENGHMRGSVHLYRQPHTFDLKACMLKQQSNGTERRLRCMDNALGRIRFCNDPYEHQAKVAGTAKLERKYFDDLPCFLHYLRLANVCKYRLPARLAPAHSLFEHSHAQAHCRPARPRAKFASLVTPRWCGG